jgi:hypothetical protein
MCELNRIELAWAKLKNLIIINISEDINMNRLQELVLEATVQISREDLKGYYRHVEKLEEEYWVFHGLMESRMEQLIINLEESGDKNSDTDLDIEDDSDSEKFGSYLNVIARVRMFMTCHIFIQDSIFILN